MIKLDLPQHLSFLPDEQPILYFIPPDRTGALTTMVPHSSLDDLLRDKAIAPGESVSGWTYWAYPPGFTRQQTWQPLVARISVEDWAGHKGVYQYEEKEETAAILENNNSMSFSKKLLDIKKFKFGKYTDYIKLPSGR